MLCKCDRVRCRAAVFLADHSLCLFLCYPPHAPSGVVAKPPAPIARFARSHSQIKRFFCCTPTTPRSPRATAVQRTYRSNVPRRVLGDTSRRSYCTYCSTSISCFNQRAESRITNLPFSDANIAKILTPHHKKSSGLCLQDPGFALRTVLT